MMNTDESDRCELSDERLIRLTLAKYKGPGFLDNPRNVVMAEDHEIKNLKRPKIIRFPKRKGTWMPLDPDPIAVKMVA